MTPETTDDAPSKFPLDYDLLEKGSIITVDTLTAIFNLPADDQRFKLKCLALTGEITRQLSERGIEATVCQCRGAIKVLTDSEATSYNERQGLLGRRKIKRSFRRLVNVDVANLTDKEREAHEKRILLLGRLNHGVTTRKMPELKPHKSMMRELGVLETAQ